MPVQVGKHRIFQVPHGAVAAASAAAGRREAREGGDGPSASGGTCPLVSAVVVPDPMHVQLRRDAGFNLPEIAQEVLMAVPPVAIADGDAAGHIEGRKQRGRSVALVVARLPLPNSGCQRQHGLGTFKACPWLSLVDAQTTARSGGFRDRPTMSRTFSTNSGSVDGLKCSTRCS